MTRWFDDRIEQLQSALEDITGQVGDDDFRNDCQGFVSDCAEALATVTGKPTTYNDAETRVVVTVELSVEDLADGCLSLLDIAIEEGLNNSPLADNGIRYVGMSKPTVLALKDWTF